MQRLSRILGAYWYRMVHSLCSRIFFSKITVINHDHLPDGGPALYLALHRNGAVDGFVYHRALPRMTAMISRQLRRNPFLRLFFSGIEVVRGKDIEGREDYRKTNRRAMDECLELLDAGGELLVFPEGTSTLGPRHLPFKGGAARIASSYLESGRSLPIIPVGVRYERPWVFRSRVEVLIGHPISTQFDDSMNGNKRTRVLRDRIDTALEEVGVNTASEADQTRIQKLAYIATLGTRHSYYRALKRFEKSVPGRIGEWLDGLETVLDGKKLLTDQDVPLFPLGSNLPYIAFLAAAGPIVVAACVLNAVPLAGGYVAARVFADDRNVIALWKILVGIPLFALWAATVAGTSVALGQPWFLGLYAATTALGLALYYRTRKLAVAVYNSLRHPSLKHQVLEFRRAVLSEWDRLPWQPPASNHCGARLLSRKTV